MAGVAGRGGLIAHKSDHHDADRLESAHPWWSVRGAAHPLHLEDTTEPRQWDSPLRVTVFESDLTAGVVEAVRTLIGTAATTESPLLCWWISLGDRARDVAITPVSMIPRPVDEVLRVTDERLEGCVV